MARERGDQQVHAKEVGRLGSGSDDTHPVWARCGDGVARRQLVVANRSAGLAPRPAEGLLCVGDCRSPQLDAGVAPRRNAARPVTHPRTRDAQARDERHRTVDADDLAVVAPQRRDRVGWMQRVEIAHLAAAVLQLAKEPPRSGPAAEPVAEHAHLDAGGGALGEERGEPAARRVSAKDVHLDMHRPPRRPDRLLPGRVVLRRVLQDAHSVSLRQGRPGGPRQRSDRDLAEHRRVRSFSLLAAHQRPSHGSRNEDFSHFGPRRASAGLTGATRRLVH